METHEYLKSLYTKLSIPVPTLHIVLGSGLSTAFDEIGSQKNWVDKGTLLFRDVPGLNISTAPGHKGVYKYFLHSETRKSLVFQVGRLHGYEGLAPRDVVQPVVSSFRAGTQQFLLTNAAGALKRNFKVGSIMLIKDHVNLTGSNPLIGANPCDESGQPLGPRFPDQSEVYDAKVRARLKKVLLKNRFSVNEGIYLGLLGPTYETPAEVSLFSKWGLGTTGMSTVWEAIALRHVGAQISGLSFVSNMGCGLDKKPLRHEDVEKIGKKIAPKLVESLFQFADLEFKK